MPTEQLTKPTHEEKLSETSIDEAISNAAEARGLSLDPQRLKRLVGQVGYRQDLESRGVDSKVQFEDNFNHVRVQKLDSADGLSISDVDFTPILDDDDEDIISGLTTPDPEHTTEITLMGIRGMQNYALLVEAGLIEKPDILQAETNPVMAITAERMGMFSEIARQHGGSSEAAHSEMREQKKLKIAGTFDEVSARLFSSDTQRLERLLIRRQAVPKPMGQVALR
jgi:hypothetical protein